MSGLNETIKFENIKEKDIREATDIVLGKADAILDEILAIPDSLRTFENTLLRLDDLYNVVSKVWNPLELLSSVSNIKAIKEVCDESSMKIYQYYKTSMMLISFISRMIHLEFMSPIFMNFVMLIRKVV